MNIAKRSIRISPSPSLQYISPLLCHPPFGPRSSLCLQIFSPLSCPLSSSCSLSRRGLSSEVSPKSGWGALGAFATTDSSMAAWKVVRQKEQDVEGLVDRYIKQNVPDKAGVESSDKLIDWNYWEGSLRHKILVEHLKDAYEQQLKLLDDALAASYPNVSNQAAEEGGLSDDWELFDAAVNSCEHAVERSEALVEGGARALWLSYRNPPAWTVAPEEWLDSDRYWQSYIERHHHYDPAKDITSYSSESFESEQTAEIHSKEWMKKVNLFHDRSDTPTLYGYMDQLHSYEFYDLHRRAFVEHMIYFLTRTGSDHRFFPEIPPTSWMLHIQELRYRYLNAAQKRREAKQLKNLSREECLDLCPPDSQIGHAEDHFFNLLQQERLNWEYTVGRLMADFIFLSEAAIPIQSVVALQRAVSRDFGKGRFYEFDDPDVSVLFYCPIGVSKPFDSRPATNDASTESSLSPSSQESSFSLLRPTQAMTNWKNHLVMSKQYVNPGYLDILAIHSELLDLRGEHWFTAPGESLADAFLRRLSDRDPSKKVFELYVKELKERWGSARELTLDEALGKIAKIDAESRNFATIFDAYRFAESSDDPSQKIAHEISSLQKSGHLSEMLDSKRLIILENEGGEVEGQEGEEKEKEVGQKVLKGINESIAERNLILEIINAAKLPTL